MMTLKSEVVGFKEWLMVCDALGAGRQSLMMRKGGIAEGKGGFQWQRDRFLLFPTHFHQQQAQVLWEPSQLALADLERPEEIVIRLAAAVEWSGRMDDWAMVEALRPHHIWKEEVVRERFGYGGEVGLSVAVVRVFRLMVPITLTMEKRFGGCRSWVDLPQAEEAVMEPVLEDAEHQLRVEPLMKLMPSGGL